MSKRNTSGVSVLARGEAAESPTRAALNADIAARYGVATKNDDEYTVMEFGELTGRKYDAANDFLNALCAAGKWERRKVGNAYVYREIKP